jgi:hypothetical protein
MSITTVVAEFVRIRIFPVCFEVSRLRLRVSFRNRVIDGMIRRGLETAVNWS